MQKKWYKYFALIGIIVFVFILSKIDFNNFLLLLKQANYRFFLLLPIFIFLVFCVQTLKWQFLLKFQGLKYKFWYLFKVQIIANYYGLLMPSRLGYFVKIAYLNKSLGVASASVIVDRILDILCLIIFACIGAFLLISSFPNLIILILIFAFCFIASVLFFYSKVKAKFLLKFVKKIIPVKFHSFLKIAFYDFYDSLPVRRKLLIPFLLTLLAWFLIYAQTYLVAQGFNLNIDFWHFIFYFPIATVVGLVPITIAGLGTREAMLILLFAQFNVSVEGIIALSLGNLIFIGCFPAIGGAFLSLKLKKHQDGV